MEGGKINMDFKLLKERGGKNEMQLNIKLTKEKRNCKNKNGVTLIAFAISRKCVRYEERA